MSIVTNSSSLSSIKHNKVSLIFTFKSLSPPCETHRSTQHVPALSLCHSFALSLCLSHRRPATTAAPFASHNRTTTTTMHPTSPNTMRCSPSKFLNQYVVHFVRDMAFLLGNDWVFCVCWFCLLSNCFYLFFWNWYDCVIF